jgi:hypothetical protein
MAAAMRLGLLAVPLLLLAGCTQETPSPPSPPGPGALPPSLLVDRSANGTLQVYVHAKQGNVRYAFINLTEFNDFEPNLTWSSRTRPFPSVYAVDLDLGVPAANLSVEVVEGDVTYRWQARHILNLTAEPMTLIVQPYDAGERAAPARDHSLPFEKLLPRAEAP